MPLLRFYLSPNLLSAEEKKDLSQKLTAIYTFRGLPAFYVNVVFLEIPPGSLYVGGEPADDFVRICIEHIALKFPSEERQQLYMKKLDDIIMSIFDPKGLRWEYHINETPRELWKIQSIIPPPHQSEGEQKWFRENRATVWE
jgi:phenylpyruvate tautomerase PptA (4-oxalocrotonate tautomerase family)